MEGIFHKAAHCLPHKGHKLVLCYAAMRWYDERSQLLGCCVLSEATRLLCLVCSPLACYLSGIAQGTHWCPFAASGSVAVL